MMEWSLVLKDMECKKEIHRSIGFHCDMNGCRVDAWSLELNEQAIFSQNLLRDQVEELVRFLKNHLANTSETGL